MPKQIIIAEQHRIAAVFGEDRIQELVVATGSHQVSDVYLGVVENVLPGIDAAFVNIGDSERNGFIHVSDLGPLRLKRSSGAITELLAPQQKVLVQVMKEPTGNKGPRLTGNVTLPGRYLVLMPFGKGVHLSRRIENETERNRLRALAILVKPAGMGLLVRTEAENIGEDAIVEDLEFLQRRWESIQAEANTTTAPALLGRDEDFVQRVLRDMYSTEVNRIVADSSGGVKRIKQHLSAWGGGKSPQGVSIDHHRETAPILDYFRVNAAVREALKPRVDLPSGGYIIIEPTEALTVVDVNSGSFTRSSTARETVLWTNCEAATEIARQLRLRNIAGVIIIDFIDMDSRRDQLQVLELFHKELKFDKARPQIAQLSELGLVELTRKRQGQNIYELFGRPCPTCGGLGHLVHLPGESKDAPAQTPTPTPAIADSRPRPAPATSLPKPVEAAIASETEPDSDLQELDLVDHPSYQSLGEGGNNRRRRRRLGLTELQKAGSSNDSDSDSDTDTESKSPERDRGPILRHRSRRFSEGEPAPPEMDEEETKLDRAKSGGRDKPDNDPPERVVVEMSPQEQEVYALMGVSPLLHLDRPVKNPKTAIVYAIAPGDPPPTWDEKPSTPTPVPAKATATPVVEEEPAAEEEPPVAAEPVVETPAPTPAPEPVEDAEDSNDSDDSESETISSSLGNRRRRRRSSASE